MTATVLRRTTFLFLGLFTLATIYVHEGWVLKPADPNWAHIAPFRWWLGPHIATGTIAFVIAPLQFSATIRRRWLSLHRWAGRVYVFAALFSSGVALYIGVTYEDPANKAVMGAMAALWLMTTLFAWFAARRGAIDQHRLWVMRSYGLTLTFVTTRFIPDVILPGLNYTDTTALYWGFVVASLVVPDLIVNGRAILPWRGKRA
jgi:uncharacterized membrane protein